MIYFQKNKSKLTFGANSKPEKIILKQLATTNPAKYAQRQTTVDEIQVAEVPDREKIKAKQTHHRITVCGQKYKSNLDAVQLNNV